MKWLHLSFFISLMVFVALGQLQRITIGPFTALYIHDVILVLWSGVMAIQVRPQLTQLITKLPRMARQHKLASLLAGIIVLGWLVAASNQTLPLWTILFVARLTLYLVWAGLVVITKPITVEWWQLGFLTCGVLIALFGLIQYTFIPDTRFLSILGWDDHYYRLISTQLDPNFTGLLLSLTLFWWWETPFSWWQWLIHGLTKKQLRQLQQGTTLAISIIVLIATGLTFSRSSWISLVVGALFLLKPKMNWKLVGTGLLLLIATVVLALKPTGEGSNLFRTSTIISRVTTSSNWLKTLTPYQLLLGRGLFVPPSHELNVTKHVEADHANLPDTILVLLISGVGIVGTVLISMLVISYVKNNQLDRLSTAVLMATICHSFFNNSLLQVFILLFVLGTLVRTHCKTKITA